MKEKKLIFTLENTLKDFESKGNLDLALDYYNPNNYFKKVYFISYNYEDKKIKHNKEWLEVISPVYFLFLSKIKKNKPIFLLLLPFVFVLHVFNLIWLIKKEDISISRTGHPYLMSLPLWLASFLTGRPFVSTIGGDNRLAQEKIGRYHIFNNKFLSFFIEEFLLNRSNNVIVPNKYSANYIKRISKQKKISIIPLPLREELFKNLKDKSTLKAPEFFLFIGRLVGDKHPDFVLEVYIEYLKNKSSKKLDLVIIGDGELRDVLEKRVKEKGLESKVTFTGFLETDGIRNYLQKNPICLIPISGFVIYEASVFGNIIITSDIEWHSEFIEDNVNGWVAKYLNKNDWISKISIIENDITKAKKKAIKLKYKVEEISPATIYNRQISLYEKVLNEN